MSRQANIPNAENCSLAELEITAKASISRKSYIRLMAMKSLILGVTHVQVIGIFNISFRTLSRWIKHFNEKGIDGLIEKHRSGRPPKIQPEMNVELSELIKNPELAGQCHWTGRKFHGYLTRELNQEVGYRTVIRWLHEQGFCLKVPRPWPDRQDKNKRKDFIERVKKELQDENTEIWYLDETGIEGDPRPRRRWAKKGEEIRHPYQGKHLRMNATGIVSPETGEFYALEFTHSDTEVFQVFLDHANKDLKFKKSRNLVILDNASWHKSKSLNWGKFEPFYLPPYSPDLNPIERLWMLLKAEWFTGFVAENMEQLLERLDLALNWVTDRKELNSKTCSIQTKL